MIEAVVFDVDGVLIRDGEFARILDARYGLTRERTSSFFQGSFQDCVIGKADLAESLAPFLRGWSWPGSVSDLMGLWFDADSTENAEVLTLAGELRANGMPCFVASTQERHRAAYLERKLGLGARFDGLFFSCHIGTKKPDRPFFDHIANVVGIVPDRLLLLDDHEANVAGAREAGWNAELYSFGDDVRATIARHL